MNPWQTLKNCVLDPKCTQNSSRVERVLRIASKTVLDANEMMTIFDQSDEQLHTNLKDTFALISEFDVRQVDLAIRKLKFLRKANRSAIYLLSGPNLKAGLALRAMQKRLVNVFSSYAFDIRNSLDCATCNVVDKTYARIGIRLIRHGIDETNALVAKVVIYACQATQALSSIESPLLVLSVTHRRLESPANWVLVGAFRKLQIS
jgi:hypothetical protein